MKPLDLLLMVHKSGDHQLRLVVETPLFTGWTTHPAGGFLAFLPSTAWPNKWCLLDFKISIVAILTFLFLTILKWSNSGAFKDLYHHLTLTPPKKTGKYCTSPFEDRNETKHLQKTSPVNTNGIHWFLPNDPFPTTSFGGMFCECLAWPNSFDWQIVTQRIDRLCYAELLQKPLENSFNFFSWWFMHLSWSTFKKREDMQSISIYSHSLGVFSLVSAHKQFLDPAGSEIALRNNSGQLIHVPWQGKNQFSHCRHQCHMCEQCWNPKGSVRWICLL